jgi:hypothetical protein
MEGPIIMDPLFPDAGLADRDRCPILALVMSVTGHLFRRSR